MSRRSVLRDIVTVLVVAALGLGGALAYAVVEIVRQGDIDEARQADAIVVLGAAQFNGVPTAVFGARLEHAVELYHQGIARILITTGGKLPGDNFTEAATARAYAVSHGVPASAILSEDKGRNTLESIEAVGAIMRAHHLTSAVFVSDRTHMLRVLRMATDQGVTAWGSPTPDSPTDLDAGNHLRAIVHEVAGLAAYIVGGGHLIDDPEAGRAP